MAGHDDMRQTSKGVWEPTTTRRRRQAPDHNARVALEHLSARRAAKHASAVIASIQDGLVTVDERGRIVDVNAVLCDMTGFHRLRLLGSRAPYPFWAHADAERNAQAIAQLLEGEFAEGGSCQLTFCRAGGERFEASVAIAPLRDADGISIGFAATIRELVNTPAAPEHDTTAAGLIRCEAAMERVAAAVSAEAPASQVYQLIAEEAAMLVGADAARIARIDDGGATMMGVWAKPGFDPRQSGGTALSADVRFGARRWGVLQTNTAAGRSTRPEAQEELTCFATLATLALAIGTMDERARTAPARDPLTGFAATGRAGSPRGGGGRGRACRGRQRRVHRDRARPVPRRRPRGRFRARRAHAAPGRRTPRPGDPVRRHASGGSVPAPSAGCSPGPTHPGRATPPAAPSRRSPTSTPTANRRSRSPSA